MKIEMPELSSQWFSLDSIEGILIVIFMIFLVARSGKRFADMIFGFLGIIFVVEILFILGQTGLNNYIPIGRFIKFDAFAALAQLIPNTKVASLLMTVSQFLTSIANELINFLIYSWESLLGNLGNIGG